MRLSMSCFLVLFAGMILVSGCETAKGAGEGMAAGVAVGTSATASGAAEGVQKDWQTLKKIDAWMQKNLW